MVFELVSLIVAPTDGAGPLIPTVPLTGVLEPPITLVGVTTIPLKVGGWIDRVAV